MIEFLVIDVTKKKSPNKISPPGWRYCGSFLYQTHSKLLTHSVNLVVTSGAP